MLQERLKPLLAKYKRYSKEGIWILVGQLMAIMGSFASVKLLTGYLPPNEYGNLFLSLTIVTFGAQIFFGPINQSSLRFFSPSVQANQFKLFNQTTKFYYKRAIMVIAAILAIGLFLVCVLHLDEKWLYLLFLTSIYAVLNGINRNLDQIQNAARQRVTVAWHNGITSWFKVLFAYLFILIFQANAVTVMCGFILSHTVVYASQYYFFKTKIKTRLVLEDLGHDDNDKKKLRVKFKDYGWPFAVWGLFTWLQQSSDRWVLKYFHGEESIAFFMVIYQLGYKPAIVGSKTLTKFLAPIFFEKAGDASDESRNKRVSALNLKVILFALAITFIGFLFTLFFYERIFEIIVDERYWKYAYMLPYMVLAGGLFTATQLSNLSIMSKLATKQLLIPIIATSIGCVCLYALLSRAYSVEGIVYSYLIFTVFQFAWIMYIKLNLKIDKKID